MELYETEEQQIAAVKKWWKENGTSLILGAVIGLSAVGGWKYYNVEQESHRIQASDMYVSIMNQIANNKDQTRIAAQVESLAVNFSDTPYAASASLALAKYDYENGNTEAAISKLSWASTNANDVETRHVARTRLIRVYLDVNRYEEAEKLLNSEHPEGFDVRYEELKGDYFVAIKEREKARVSYDKAIALSDGNTDRWLKLKRQELGN